MVRQELRTIFIHPRSIVRLAIKIILWVTNHCLYKESKPGTIFPESKPCKCVAMTSPATESFCYTRSLPCCDINTTYGAPTSTQYLLPAGLNDSLYRPIRDVRCSSDNQCSRKRRCNKGKNVETRRFLDF